MDEEAGEVLGERGLGLVGRVERLGPQLGEARGQVGAGRLERGGVLADDEHADDLLRHLEAVPELAVVLLGSGVDVGEHLVHRVLEQARVAPGGAGGDLVALVEADAHAVLGEERGERASDDPAADHGDVSVWGHRGQANVRAWHRPPKNGSRSSPRRWGSPCRPAPR